MFYRPTQLNGKPVALVGQLLQFRYGKLSKIKYTKVQIRPLSWAQLQMKNCLFSRPQKISLGIGFSLKVFKEKMFCLSSAGSSLLIISDRCKSSLWRDVVLQTHLNQHFILTYLNKSSLSRLSSLYLPLAAGSHLWVCWLWLMTEKEVKTVITHQLPCLPF